MVELTAQTPLDGMAPLTIGDVTLSETDLGTLTSVAPFQGQTEAVAEIFKSAHGLDWPAPGQMQEQDGRRAIWFGRDMVLLAGPDPDARLAQHAALTDQTDAWTCVSLSGPGTDDILARLVPVDLRAGAFPVGSTARSLVQHMNGSVTRTASDTFLILVFRSMARTLLHVLQRAMASIAARG